MPRELKFRYTPQGIMLTMPFQYIEPVSSLRFSHFHESWEELKVRRPVIHDAVLALSRNHFEEHNALNTAAKATGNQNRTWYTCEFERVMMVMLITISHRRVTSSFVSNSDSCRPLDFVIIGQGMKL
jgi:hypothetical protein